MISPLRSREDQVKVLDFGIAKIKEEPAEKRLTVKGQIFGTPGFMAPEQILGEEATELSDIYSCGAILFFMLTGREVFNYKSAVEALSMVLHNDPTPLREAAPELGYSEQLEQLVAR